MVVKRPPTARFSRVDGLCGSSSGFDLIFHSVAFAFDDHGFGMMQQTVKKSRGQGAVVVEDFRPLLVRAVRRDNRGPSFVALADDLEEEIGAMFVNGEIAEGCNQKCG